MQPSQRQNQPIQHPRRTYLAANDDPLPASASQRNVNDASQHAAANIARSQVQSAYQRDTYYAQPSTQPASQPAPTQQQPTVTPAVSQDAPFATDTYNRSHDESTLHAHQEQWQRYHSAWQNYYQQYFQSYYSGHIAAIQKNLKTQEERAKELEAKVTAANETRPAETETAPTATTVEKPYSQQETVKGLRAQLRSTISQRAKVIRKSTHFVPVVSALVVIFIFLTLQYGRVMAAHFYSITSPGLLEPENVIIDHKTNLKVGPEPRLIIPKINVDVPVVYNTKPDHDSQMDAMARGAAWFGIPGANSKPGQVGNTVISAHSSNGFLDNGEYKFIFANLEDMKIGDTIYANYESTRYTYRITKMDVVLPSNVQALVYPTEKPMLTLITCTPLGTSEKRLLVTAEQIYPAPAQAKAAPERPASQEKAAMPGNSPTFFERLFGGGNS